MNTDIPISKIKLVIWDLDDTFWNGTLSEEGIELNLRNIEIVKTLTDRGIINSICSKNTEKEVNEVLERNNLSYYFVFNKITWSPKGEQIKNTLTEMGLRPDNTIFIDDNLNNLNEVKQFNPGITVVHPDDILDELLSLESASGKEDKLHSRLKQYKILEKKNVTKKTSNLSNIDFLRSCNLKVKINHDCLGHIDRIFELIDRTNQLNYTKQRLNTVKDKDNLLKKINSYKYNAGIVSCSDDYGNYDVVGFFLVRQENSHKGTLEHFVFSCRVINMGVEYFIYDYLNKPSLIQVKPLAYDINNYSLVDWISIDDETNNINNDNTTMLIGPCHLLQLSNFFKTDLNFVQYMNFGSIIKFDCPSFLLGKKEDLETSSFLSEGFTWTYDEYIAFHSNLKSVKFLIVSLEDLISDREYIVDNNCLFRYEGIKKTNYKTITLDFNSRVKMLFDTLNYLIDKVSTDCEIVILDSIITDKTPSNLKCIRIVYSHILYKHYQNKIRIIDTSCYSSSTLSDGVHLNRQDYYNIYYDIINKQIRKSTIDYTCYDNKNNLMQIFYNFRLRFIRNYGSDSLIYKFVYKLTKILKK